MIGFSFSSLKAIAEVLNVKPRSLKKFAIELSENFSSRMLRRLSKIDYVAGSFGQKIDCSEFSKSEIDSLRKFWHNEL